MSAKTKSAALAQTEKHFGKDHQPPAALKKLGWAKRRLVAEVLQAKLPNPEDSVNFVYLNELAAAFGMAPKDMSIALAMHLKMAQKAIFEGNVQAYTALLNRAYGLPNMHIESKSAKLVHVQVTFDDKLPPTQEIIPIG